MTGELIIFPVRVYARVVRFTLRSTVEVTSRALSLATLVIRSATPEGSAEAPERTVADVVATTGPADVAEPADDTISVPAPRAEAPAQESAVFAPPPEATPLRTEPIHVSEEPAVVDEFAEPGAEEGAGAEVTVAEPWEGYAAMTAQDVVARLGHADSAELAAVELYETSHRRRSTVIAAVEHELRAKSQSSAPAGDQTRKEHTDG